jgi:hypothetical protein
MQYNNRWMVVILLIVAVLQLSACTRASTAKPKSEPAILEPIEGSDLKRVVLTEKAAERLDLRTAPVREEQVVRKRTVGGEVVALPEEKGAGSSKVWVRALLTESDLNRVDRSQPALVLPPGLDDEEDSDAEETGLTAEPDEGPFDDPEEGDAALYYAVDSAEHSLAPGQIVFVKLSLLGSGTQRKVVPYGAVLYDVDGKTWVYTNPEPLVFVRHPVSIDYIEGDLAVLLEGPPVDTEVVMVGVAELFGAETGVGK